MKIQHNKLVRDRVPEIITEAGKVFKTRKLDDSKYILELNKKLLEEANEVVLASSKIELINELADVIEVIDAIKKANDIDEEEVLKVKDAKFKSNGGFENQIYLEYVVEE